QVVRRLVPLAVDVGGRVPPVLAEERLEVEAVRQVDVQHQQAGGDADEPEGGRVGRAEPEVLPPLPRGRRGGFGRGDRRGRRRWGAGGTHFSWLQLNTRPSLSSALSTSAGVMSRAWTDR